MTPALPFDPIEAARGTWAERGWVDAADGMAAVTSVMRAHQIMLARVDDALRPLGLTFARYELLMLLQFSRTGSLPLSKIGSRLQVHPASVTNVVDRLESASASYAGARTRTTAAPRWPRSPTRGAPSPTRPQPP